MSTLSKYIEQVKKITEGMSEDEKARYIYIDLGKRLSFNLNFSFGNTKTKRQIYRETMMSRVLDENLRTNIIICKSSCRIYEMVLKELGIDILTFPFSEDYKSCPHVYNVIRPADGRESYIADLQLDLENIQSHSRTKYFGVSSYGNTTPIISRDQLEEIDKRIGYISKDNYYADEYIYLLKSDIGLFTDFREKVGFVLENIDIYHNKNMKYAERKWHHETMLGQLFTREELNKIQQIDCYIKDENGDKHYIPCIIVSVPKDGIDVYMFSVEDNQYHKITLEQLADQTRNGLVILQKIPELNQILRRRKQIDTDAEGR